MKRFDLILNSLPQTQCKECGFDGCRPYAMAIDKGISPIDLCPPGGHNTLKKLGDIMGIETTPFENNLKIRAPSIAVIREDDCIGCTKCIQACPVDAIIGTGKHMHTVISHECTGCGLCVEPCPVDCIDIIPQAMPIYDKKLALARHDAHIKRQIQSTTEKAKQYQAKKQLTLNQSQSDTEKSAKQAYILEALKRVSTKQTS